MDTAPLITVITGCLASVLTFARWAIRFLNSNNRRRHEEILAQKSEHHEAMSALQKQFIDALIANTASNVVLSEKIESVEKRVEDMVAFRERTVYRPGRD